jgi:hypothetical protein
MGNVGVASAAGWGLGSGLELDAIRGWLYEVERRGISRAERSAFTRV